MEAQCVAAFIHQLPGGANAECGSGGAGSGQFASDGVLELPGACTGQSRSAAKWFGIAPDTEEKVVPCRRWRWRDESVERCWLKVEGMALFVDE